MNSVRDVAGLTCFRDLPACSNADTCGLNKNGEEQYKVDPLTGARLEAIDDELYESVSDLRRGKKRQHVYYVNRKEIERAKVAVPCYFDRRSEEAIIAAFKSRTDFQLLSVGKLIESGLLLSRKGHGSPSQDQRVGDVPYIKVSDLRAGLVNVNPSNRIPRTLAEQFWGGTVSGLEPFDLLSPERASKNIGEFCVLLPGQEDVVLTKEIIVFRASRTAAFDQFYLMWALSLELVRSQWTRVIFMQTNREDVGRRFEEILLPIPRDKKIAQRAGAAFREYFQQLSDIKNQLRNRLDDQGLTHHVFFV